MRGTGGDEGTVRRSGGRRVASKVGRVGGSGLWGRRPRRPRSGSAAHNTAPQYRRGRTACTAVQSLLCSTRGVQSGHWYLASTVRREGEGGGIWRLYLAKEREWRQGSEGGPRRGGHVRGKEKDGRRGRETERGLERVRCGRRRFGAPLQPTGGRLLCSQAYGASVGLPRGSSGCTLGNISL